MRHQARQAGFTIAELMVALVIMGVVTSATLATFASLHRNYTNNQRVADTQEDARLITEMVLSDVRMAGFLVPPSAAIASVDGGAGGPDALCTSDPAVMAEAQIQAAFNFFDRAVVLNTIDSAETTVSLVPSSLDVDGDGNNDFAVGAGIIVADGGDSHCAQVTAIVGGDITFAPPTPPGFSVSAGTGRAVPARIYQIAGNVLSRDGLPLADQVENLQVEYFVDANGNGLIDGAEFPVHDLNGSDAGDVRSVRISVLTLTAAADPRNPGVGMPATGNHAGGPPDGFTRRRYVTNVVPRNLLN